MATNKLYKPFNGFDGPDYTYKLKPTSKGYVREVCDVQAKRMVISDKLRCEYADQAGYPVSEKKKMADGSVRRVFELSEVYSEYHIHAAMAQAMFFDFPQLIEVTEKDDEFTIDILNQELFDALDDGQVNAAFLGFMSDRNGIPGGRSAS